VEKKRRKKKKDIADSKNSHKTVESVYAKLRENPLSKADAIFTTLDTTPSWDPLSVFDDDTFFEIVEWSFGLEKQHQLYFHCTHSVLLIQRTQMITYLYSINLIENLL
jgi:hypothetical protein